MQQFLQRLFLAEFLQSDNRWRTIDAIPDPAATRVIELAQTSSRAGSPPSCGCPAGRPWPGATRPLVALPDVIFVPCRPRRVACNALRRALPMNNNYAYILPSKGRRRRLISPHLEPGGVVARARTAPPREVPVDCSSTNSARERDATRRREGALWRPGGQSRLRSQLGTSRSSTQGRGPDD